MVGVGFLASHKQTCLVLMEKHVISENCDKEIKQKHIRAIFVQFAQSYSNFAARALC